MQAPVWLPFALSKERVTGGVRLLKLLQFANDTTPHDWLNARHQGTSKQGNEVELQSLFTHTILNAFLTFRRAL